MSRVFLKSGLIHDGHRYSGTVPVYTLLYDSNFTTCVRITNRSTVVFKHTGCLSFSVIKQVGIQVVR